jgi:hypothetical protein
MSEEKLLENKRQIKIFIVYNELPGTNYEKDLRSFRERGAN